LRETKNLLEKEILLFGWVDTGGIEVGYMIAWISGIVNPVDHQLLTTRYKLVAI